MKQMKVFRLQDGKMILDRCHLTDSFVERAVGLLNKSGLQKGEGLWIEPCRSIHTFFMRFAIDVVYLDGAGRILKITRGFQPWRLDFPVWSARAVLELPVGGADDLKKGDVLCLS